jgi:hypothetical protein
VTPFVGEANRLGYRMTEQHEVRKPWTEPRVETLGTAADARNQLFSSPDGQGTGHKKFPS